MMNILLEIALCLNGKNYWLLKELSASFRVEAAISAKISVSFTILTCCNTFKTIVSTDHYENSGKSKEFIEWFNNYQLV
jgi:hypothetical protein